MGSEDNGHEFQLQLHIPHRRTEQDTSLQKVGRRACTRNRGKLAASDSGQEHRHDYPGQISGRSERAARSDERRRVLNHDGRSTLPILRVHHGRGAAVLELPAAAHQRKFCSRTSVRPTYCMAERSCSRKAAASIITFARQPADLSVGWPANWIDREREDGQGMLNRREREGQMN